MKKIIYLTLAFICLGVGSIGVVLPILPTTPFLLAASFCFAKGSDKFNNWFTNTKLYKNNLESFVKNKSMTMKTKLAILIPVTVMLLLAIYFVPIRHVKYFIIALMVIKYYYFIFCIKTEKPGEDEKN